MQISNAGREYITFEVEDAAGTIMVTFNSGSTWHPVETVSDTEVRVLVAGPAATGNPVGTVVLAAGFYGIFLHLDTGTEDAFRPAGNLTVTSTL